MIESKELLDAAQVKMDKVIAHLTEELASVRAGKASVNVLNGILVANIGLTPSNNGEHIRLNIPPLTEERRKELVKQIKAETETARVSLRGIRRDLVDAFKKAQKDGMPEDAAKDGEESAQKLTDKYAKKVDDLFSAKEKEIMTV